MTQDSGGFAIDGSDGRDAPPAVPSQKPEESNEPSPGPLDGGEGAPAPGDDALDMETAHERAS